MRVITGTARGRKLETLDGLSTRPTTERVKEALFSAIHFDLPGAYVLDLFAGSGQLGIEALSRGSRFCVFIDMDNQCRDVIRKNLQTVKMESVSRVAVMDACQFLATTKDKFDLVFLDPPYESGIYERVFNLLSPKLTENGTVVCESLDTEELPEEAGKLKFYRKYRYGKSKISIYKKGSGDE